MPAQFRYSRWDGTQNLDLLDADDVLDALSDDLMSYGDLNAALQRLYRWGAGDMPGLEQLLRQHRRPRARAGGGGALPLRPRLPRGVDPGAAPGRDRHGADRHRPQGGAGDAGAAQADG